MFNLLPEYRRKKNNKKVCNIIQSEFDELEDTICKVEDWKDINNAKGTTLDMIGAEIGQQRGNTTDEVYRLLIKGKNLSNNSKGDINSVIKIISSILEIEPTEFQIEESYTKDEKLSGNISISKIPVDVLLEHGISSNELMYLTKRSLAAGIGIDTLQLSGTFEFVKELEENQEFGFSDIEMTTGGTLGAIYEGGNI